MDTEIYRVDVVLDIPLFHPLTYQTTERLVPGTRVQIPFRGRFVCGIVWGEAHDSDLAAHKIKSIEQVFYEESVLLPSWRELVEFASRYYHYPIGQTVFTALPYGLRQNKPVSRRAIDVCFSLTSLGKEQPVPAIAHKQKYLLWLALQQGMQCLSALKKISNQAAKYLRLWLEKGWIEKEDRQTGQPSASPYDLNAEQLQVVSCVMEQTDKSVFAPFLLHGITGSGKTEVYFSIMAEILSQGKQVLFLLPEISLTPQLLARVKTRFASVPTVILHSQMAEGERTQNYLDALEGHARLVIGTRLSVFTPMPNLGLIIVDEEHDASFKQEEELRYHARDLALWRAKQAGCVIILGSATPSLESYHHAKQGKYTLLTLSKRANMAATLPDIRVHDVHKQKLDHGFTSLAQEVLKKNFEQNGLSLVYLNRRGFAPVLVCASCGFSFGCPHCSARMVVHKFSRNLRCHHCNYIEPIPHICPNCGNQDLSALGQGTQRIEEALTGWLPQAKIARVDRDSTSRKHDWEHLYQRIEQKEIDVLIGTQMLSKGHDFPDLNLVIVLNVDSSLYSPDFRSSERLFSELMQVSGRAGRAEKKGRVLIQTAFPEHMVFQALKTQNYVQFAEEELRLRQQFGFSPFQHSIALKADALSLAQAMAFLTQVRDQLVLPESVQVMGPAPAFMMRLAGRERAQLFFESASRKALHQTIHLLRPYLSEYIKAYKHLRVAIDVDPLTA